jgi:hypothetical protein
LAGISGVEEQVDTTAPQRLDYAGHARGRETIPEAEATDEIGVPPNRGDPAGRRYLLERLEPLRPRAASPVGGRTTEAKETIGLGNSPADLTGIAVT